MVEYHAAYFREPDGWYIARVLDFPGALSQGRTLRSAQRMIRDALRLLAECMVESGQPLPRPNPRARARNGDYFEAIPLSVHIQTSG